MSNSNETNGADSNNINTKQVIKVIGFIVLSVVGFYFANFHNGLSRENGAWGTFGDYFGGILNPVIAAFAFYLIAKTYELQKKELEATRSLLEVSTDAQKNQIVLAALTALLNSNLTRIGVLEAEKIALLQGTLPVHKKPTNESEDRQQGIDDMKDARRPKDEVRKEKIRDRLQEIEDEANRLTEMNSLFEEQIKNFLKAL
ncbi:hypothetical protein [Methylobacter sp.]|uniref:hypothetical protein n=1 Tax=Methylobacter sp. TaxID=2051955 RepID=UPI001202C852|nr:hypothetical protein [Methylobacter sp.]TAK59810.1 MAG: hypothetical protein EPO18_19440 [Methylobacter sp.]